MEPAMLAKYILPMLAVLGVTFAGYTVYKSRQTPPPSQPLISPPTAPPKVKTIAGAGLVEARKENIPIGVNIPGVVTEIYIKKGDYVKAGDPLFRIDDRDYRAQLRIREADLASAKAQLHRLVSAPRAEDVPPAEAAVAEARAKLEDAEAKARRSEKLYQRQMIAPSDYDVDRFGFAAAQAALSKADADLKRIKAGSWKEDIEVARAAVQLAQSQVDSIKTDLQRLTVHALIDGEVLQLNVRLGQYAAMAWREPMIVLGDVNRLHVRVDIDENDLPYFEKGADAVATLKGRPQARFPLKFVYVEPYVIPKQSLTGYNSERVDTRVLQVIYQLPDDRPVDLYVGQQMDVYLRAAKAPKGVSLETDLNLPRLPFDDEEAAPLAKAQSAKP
jgi:multidrug resistance efflux pump